jgi:hypothetical protein
VILRRCASKGCYQSIHRFADGESQEDVMRAHGSLGTPVARSLGRHFTWTWALVLPLALLAACESRSPLQQQIRPAPVVASNQDAKTSEAMKLVAVVPFQPRRPTGRSVGTTASVTWDNAALVSSYFTDALVVKGVSAIPPSDLAGAFANQGDVVPRLNPRVTAEKANQDFGATAVVIGMVTRWREREGSAAGAKVPASIAFEISLHEAPSGRRLWTGRFDETQKSMTESIFRARQYPGGGMRWLSAEEFARWGAEEVAKSMTLRP